MRNGLVITCFVIACSMGVFYLFNACKPKDKKLAVVEKPKDICHIRFFLETSASMGGYMKGDTRFSNLVPDVLVELENKVDFKNKPIKISYIADNISQYRGNTRDFIHDISTVQVAQAKGSEMHKIFQRVADSNDSNDISILVSDCILSYPDENVKQNREINKDKAGGELKTSIKDEFLKLKGQHIVASVYGFNSGFNGTYYNYRNDKMKLSPQDNINRPFYFWVVGQGELIRRFNQRLSGIKSFSPEFKMDFGMFNKPIKEYTILFKTERAGDWTTDYQQITDLSVTKNKPCQFAIAVNFSSLPDYARSIAYLSDHLRVDADGAACKLVAIRNAGDVDKMKAAPKERPLLDTSTHIMVFEVTELYRNEANIHVRLPLMYDQSYLEWSTMDDTQPGLLSGKTFAFKHLIEGVTEAYQNDSLDFVNLTITLKK